MLPRKVTIKKYHSNTIQIQYFSIPSPAVNPDNMESNCGQALHVRFRFDSGLSASSVRKPELPFTVFVMFDGSEQTRSAAEMQREPCRCSLTAEHQPSKLGVPVRFRSVAPAGISLTLRLGFYSYFFSPPGIPPQFTMPGSLGV